MIPGMSTFPSFSTASRAWSIVMNVPVLPTPALLGEEREGSESVRSSEGAKLESSCFESVGKFVFSNPLVIMLGLILCYMESAGSFGLGLILTKYTYHSKTVENPLVTQL